MKELEVENNRLRDSLKELNEQLTKIVERSRLSNLAPKKVEFKNKNVEDRLRTTLKEIENNQKILEFTATEYTTLKTRLDQIKNPEYILDLDEKIDETYSKIESTKKANKGLYLVNGNVGKDLDEIDKADGVAPMIQEANEKAKELAVLKKKLQKLQEGNKAFEEEDSSKSSKYEQLQRKYRKTQAEAERYNVKFEDEKLIIQYTNLKAQVKSLEDHLKFTSNKNEKYLKNQVERAIEDLYVANMKENENIERLDAMIEEQKDVLREMVEQEEHRTDKATREVIGKIKASLDGNPLSIDPSLKINEISKTQTKSAHNLQSKQPATTLKNNKEKYTDLPVFDVSKGNIKVDSLLNKKDLIKKEITALKEKARLAEDQNSLTPRADKEGKEKFLQNKTNSKPNLREKRKENIEDQNKFQQAEQQKQKSETRREEKDPNNVNLKPNFAKPNLFKKSENSSSQTEALKLPDTNADKPNNNDFSHGMTLNTNRSSAQKEGQLAMPGQSLTKKEELKLPGQEKPLVLGSNQNTPLGLKNQENKIFLTNQEGYNSNKKEELSLPGTFNDQKKPLDMKKNDEYVFNQNNKKSQQQMSIPENKIKSKNNIGEDEIGETINLGGLSRLNRLKKGTNATGTTYEPEKVHGLELPSQRQSVNPSNNNLTLEFNKQDNKTSLNQEKTEGRRARDTQLNNDLFGKNDDDLFGTKNNDFGKKQNLHGEELSINKTQAGGRDRSHLAEKKTNDDDFLFNNDKKEKSNNLNTGFDPDDIFGNPKIETRGNKNDNLGGMALAGLGLLGKDSLGGNFGTNETTNRRREVKNAGLLEDEDPYPYEANSKKMTNNPGLQGLGFAGLELGKETKFNNENNNDTEIKIEPKRMRMNDLNKKTDNKDKVKNF